MWADDPGTGPTRHQDHTLAREQWFNKRNGDDGSPLGSLTLYYFPTCFFSLRPVDQNLMTLDLYFEILYSQEVEFQYFNRYMLDSILDKDSL